MTNLQAIAQHYGGAYRNGRALIPTPGHSRRDRGTSISEVRGAPDGILVHCFNGTETDAIAVKSMLRKDGFLARRETRDLTEAEKDQLKRDRAERDLQAYEGEERTAEVAREIWACGREPDAAHPYLRAKNVPACGIRETDGNLIIPMADATGTLWNVQQILPSGRKLFLTSGRVNGTMHLHDDGTGPLVIGEGYASMAAIHRATGLSFAAAFTASNLRAVATLLRARFRDRELLIAADDDGHLVANPNIARNLGIDAATKAAAWARAELVVPRSESTATGIDFADLADAEIRARFNHPLNMRGGK